VYFISVCIWTTYTRKALWNAVLKKGSLHATSERTGSTWIRRKFAIPDVGAEPDGYLERRDRGLRECVTTHDSFHGVSPRTARAKSRRMAFPWLGVPPVNCSASGPRGNYYWIDFRDVSGTGTTRLRQILHVFSTCVQLFFVAKLGVVRRRASYFLPSSLIKKRIFWRQFLSRRSMALSRLKLAKRHTIPA